MSDIFILYITAARVIRATWKLFHFLYFPPATTSNSVKGNRWQVAMYVKQGWEEQRVLKF
jgi:hypothetical protein